jgi:hypothetical protein
MLTATPKLLGAAEPRSGLREAGIGSDRVAPRRFSTLPRATHRSQDTEPTSTQTLGSRIAQLGCAAALSLALAVSPPSAAALDRPTAPATASGISTASLRTPTVSNDVPFLDLARVVPSGKIDALQTQLRQLEADTGWRVRVLTRFGPSDTPSIEQLRSGWSVDEKTVVVFLDPSAPNIMQFNYGRAVQDILHRPFFTELQSRYGNLYFVRENGEQAAMDGVMGALDTCFRRGGCAVPPGLPSEQFYFTVVSSIAGGLILGSVLRIDPQGFVKRRWVYGLLFAPLWASLSINFGLGPVVSRTDDVAPVVANVLATLASAALVYWYPQAAKMTGLSMDRDDDGDGGGP